jgi:PAS domain S-box-containing protein/putative nucleotidyltransferase with HDIG domain
LDPGPHISDLQTRVEETLRASEERFRLLVENAPDAIVMYDSEQRRFVDANAQAEVLFGCGREEIVMYGPEHFYASEQPDGRPVAESIAEHNRRALAGEQLSYERCVRRPTGEDRICQVTMVSLPSAQGRLQRASFVDITERKRSERRLARTNRALRTLSHGNEVVVRSASEADLLDQMCRVIVETGGYRMAWIGSVEHDASKSVRLVAHTGEGSVLLAEELKISWDDVPAGRGTTGRAIRSGEPQVSQDLLADPSMAPWAALAKQHGIASAATFPLRDHSRVFAILLIYADEPGAFDVDELKLLQELADDLSYGINALRDRVEHAALERRWRSSLVATVGAIANTVEVRDPYTAGHQQRVARLAAAMARTLGMSEHDAEGIYLAGIVHDVGKINVPAEILNKPGKLSKAEFSLIREHAEAGYNILKGIDFPWPIAQMVRQHHERLDGSGYPLGLKGDAILAEAKVLAVADVVDSMASHRPYRPAMGIESALVEIEKNKARFFDPAVVDACLALFRSKGFSFDDPVPSSTPASARCGVTAR